VTVDPLEVACALENVPGVRGVYTVEPGSKGPVPHAIFIEIEETHHLLVGVEAYAALHRFLRYEDCEAINICHVAPPRMALRRVDLSASDRAAARERIARRTADMDVVREEEERVRADRERHEANAARIASIENTRLLLVGADAHIDLHASARQAFPGGDIVCAESLLLAFAFLSRRTYDLVLCRADLGFGGAGFLAELGRVRRWIQPEQQCFVAVEEERRAAALKETSRYAGCLLEPVTVKILRLARASFFNHVAVRSRLVGADAPLTSAFVPPSPHSRKTHSPRPEPVRTSRVLVVDDDPSSEALAREWSPNVHVIVTADPFIALEKIAMDEAIDLVFCSATMKTAGDQAVYRLLWNARPQMKSRFVLLFTPASIPSSVRCGSQAAVSRPLTMKIIAERLQNG
jgi:hypothetical protein